jgi:hypothetical protein
MPDLTEAWYGLRGVTRSAIRIWMIIVVWLFLFSATPIFLIPLTPGLKRMNGLFNHFKKYYYFGLFSLVGFGGGRDN